jgi:hypothetical protein
MDFSGQADVVAKAALQTASGNRFIDGIGCAIDESVAGNPAGG